MRSDWLLTKDPLPKVVHDHCVSDAKWKITHSENLDRYFPVPSCDYFSVLEKRRTTRTFNTIDNSVLSGILWSTLRDQALIDVQANRLYRPVPSAGAAHAISLLVIQPDGVIWKYDGRRHAKQFIEIASSKLSDIYNDCFQILDPGNGCILILAADLSRIEPYYEDYESLVWRDSGVILSTLALTSEAYDIAFCPLGISGNDWLDELCVTDKKILRGVGVALIGGR